MQALAPYSQATSGATSEAPCVERNDPIPRVSVSTIVLSPTQHRDHKIPPHSRVHPNVFNKNSDRCLDCRISRLWLPPTTCGGFADIWEGVLGDQKVAIKTLRLFSSNGARIDEDKLLKVMHFVPL
jgi:hypothetical protein